MTRHCWVFILVSTTTALAQEPPRHPPIIDMHLHVSPTDEYTGEPQTPTADTERTMKEFVGILEQRNVAIAVAFGPLQYVKMLTAMAPQRFFGSPAFPIPHAEGRFPDLSALRRAYAAGQLKAMGEILAQYHGLAPTHASLEPYFALAERLDIPVGIHMGLAPPGVSYPRKNTWYNVKYRVSLGNPLLLEEVLIRHPRLRLWVMHAGWPMLDEMTGLLWAHPKVHADLAALQYLPRKEYYDYLRRLIQAGFANRLMHGSDGAPGDWPGGSVEAIEEAPFLTAEQKRDILCNNAARFLRLEVVSTCGSGSSGQ